MSQTKDWGRHEGVVVIPRRSDGRIYLAKRLSKDRPFCGCYAAPGGSVEEGEVVFDAALRELKEETGLVVDGDRLVFLVRTGPHLTPADASGSGKPYMMTYYLLDLEDGEAPQQTEPEKQSPWQARSYMSWALGEPLVPGFEAQLEKVHYTKRGSR